MQWCKVRYGRNQDAVMAEGATRGNFLTLYTRKLSRYSGVTLATTGCRIRSSKPLHFAFVLGRAAQYAMKLQNGTECFENYRLWLWIDLIPPHEVYTLASTVHKCHILVLFYSVTGRIWYKIKILCLLNCEIVA